MEEKQGWSWRWAPEAEGAGVQDPSLLISYMTLDKSPEIYSLLCKMGITKPILKGLGNFKRNDAVIHTANVWYTKYLVNVKTSCLEVGLELGFKSHC